MNDAILEIVTQRAILAFWLLHTIMFRCRMSVRQSIFCYSNRNTIYTSPFQTRTCTAHPCHQQTPFNNWQLIKFRYCVNLYLVQMFCIRFFLFVHNEFGFRGVDWVILLHIYIFIIIFYFTFCRRVN